MAQALFTPHGGYRTLDTFMLSTIIYYGTVAFCRKHIPSGRQTEQMVQAARSGRQNIAEGSERSATSTHTEIQLTDVACASLAELQLDYEDFIHFSSADPWSDDCEDSLAIRQVRLERMTLGPNEIRRFSQSVRGEMAKFGLWLNSDDPVITANAMVRLCDRACFLLRRQLASQGERFVENGGFKERMAQERNKAKDAACENPVCPKCGAPMRMRTVRKGERAGQTFWGCSKYPACDGVKEMAQ
jgi:four helix bundle suffix protein